MREALVDRGKYFKIIRLNSARNEVNEVEIRVESDTWKCEF